VTGGGGGRREGYFGATSKKIFRLGKGCFCGRCRGYKGAAHIEIVKEKNGGGGGVNLPIAIEEE